MALNYSSYSSATSPLIHMMVNIFPYQISTSTCAVWSSYQKSFARKVSCSILFDKKSLSEIFFAHNTKLIFVGSSLSAFWQLHPYHFIHWSKNYSEILVCFCYDAIWNNPSGMKRWVLKFFFMDFNLIFLLCFFSLSFEGSSLLFHAEVSFKSSDSLTMDIKSSLSSLMEINKGKEMKKSLFLLFAYSFNAGSSC